MLYEFIAGDVPFGPNDEDPIDIYKSVLYGKLSYPGYVSKNNKAIPFIEQLLNKNPALRGNAQTLKKHD